MKFLEGTYTSFSPSRHEHEHKFFCLPDTADEEQTQVQRREQTIGTGQAGPGAPAAGGWEETNQVGQEANQEETRRVGQEANQEGREATQEQPASPPQPSPVRWANNDLWSPEIGQGGNATGAGAAGSAASAASARATGAGDKAATRQWEQSAA